MRPRHAVDARPARLDSLTGLRFLAAILVVVHHTVANDVHHHGLVALPLLRPLATLGYTGVTFFFVLSGFVLTWSWAPGRRRRDFWVRRVARVYPLHAVSWAVSIPVLISTKAAIGFLPAVLSLFLLQSWSTSSDVAFGMNGLSWSLSCEAFFYLVFPFLIRRLANRSDRTLWRIVAGCVVLLAAVPSAVYAVGGKSSIAFLYYFPAYRVLEFIIGICLALIVSRGWRPSVANWSGPAAIVLSLLITIGLSRVYAHVGGGEALPRALGSFVMLPGYAYAIVAGAVTDVRGRRSWLSSTTMVKLGTWSFALYMTHLLFITGVESAVGASRSYTGLTGYAVLAGVAICAVTISALVFTWIERPAERLIRQRLSSKTRASTDEARLPSS